MADFVERDAGEQADRAQRAVEQALRPAHGHERKREQRQEDQQGDVHPDRNAEEPADGIGIRHADGTLSQK